MVKRTIVACVAIFATFSSAVADAPVVLVTGATGATGSLLYAELKQKGVEVRAFVRNATKAKGVLHCDKCDESEGIYVGDLTEKASIEEAVRGITTLAVASSAFPICPDQKDFSKCYYEKGAYPVDVDFNGGRNQFEALAAATSGKGHVVLCSSMGTTQPDNFLDKLGNGFIGFYKLNEEAALMSYNLAYTIVKPCGLLNTPGSTNTLTVNHYDEGEGKGVSRSDVAHVMAEAVMHPQRSFGLRFDLCSQEGPPTTDIGNLFDAARFPWDHHAKRIVV